MTYADVWIAAKERRLYDWDLAAFVASCALNSGSFRFNKWKRVDNPHRAEVRRVTLAEVSVPELKEVEYRERDRCSD